MTARSESVLFSVSVTVSFTLRERRSTTLMSAPCFVHSFRGGTFCWNVSMVSLSESSAYENVQLKVLTNPEECLALKATVSPRRTLFRGDIVILALSPVGTPTGDGPVLGCPDNTPPRLAVCCDSEFLPCTTPTPIE